MNTETKITVCRDTRDNFILELAIDCNAGAIITFDKDLLIIKKYMNVSIFTPIEFLRMMENDCRTLPLK
ncbi:MAG: putative toxin-antitoxin system toxin component, PIN family [Candidatus Dojkabacteria bacterium]